MKQGKQGKLPKNKEEQRETKGKTREITFEQAKNEIYQLIRQGTTYRDISETTFSIVHQGRRHFSISQISKIKQEFEPNQREITPPVSENENADSQKVIVLLNKNWELKDIVIETGLTPKFILKTSHEFLELKKYPPRLIDDFYKIANSFGKPCKDPEELKSLFSKCLIFQEMLEDLHFNCCNCGKPISLNPFKNLDWDQDVDDAMGILSTHVCHRECFSQN